MKNIRKNVFIFFAILFHNTSVLATPKPLETSLMLLKAKLLSLAEKLKPDEVDKLITQASLDTVEATKEDLDVEIFLDIFYQILEKTEKATDIPTSEILSCFLAGRSELERILFLLNRYKEEDLKKILIKDTKIEGKKITTPQDKVYYLKDLPQNEILRFTAKNWIRNAAVSVLEYPLRSFLEIVVNGADATVNDPAQRVGKFGMGFFSILALLWFRDTGWNSEKYGTTITITTATKDPKTSNIKAFSLSFYRKPSKDHPGDPKYDDIVITMRKPEEKEKITSTGTRIVITPNNNNNTFSQETLETLSCYVHYLDTYTYVPIKLGNTTINAAAANLSPVVITLGEKSLEVIDAGTGMTLKTVLFSLLVPSSSTKGQDETVLQKSRENALANQSPELPSLIDFKGKTKSSEKKSHFLITVNGVVVIDKELQQPTKDENGNVKDLVIPMPQATQLTLARNELSITESPDNFERQYLEKLLDATIEKTFKEHDKKNGPLLLALHRGLKEWESQSAAQHIKGVFSHRIQKKLREEFKKENAPYPVPEEFAQQRDQCSTTLDMIPSAGIPLDNELVDYNFSAFEDTLYKTYINKTKENVIKTTGANEKLIAGYRVYFVPDDFLPKSKDFEGKYHPILSTLGTRRSLFVPESFLTDEKGKERTRTEVSEEICSRYTLSKLHTVPEIITPTKKETPMCIITTNATDFFIPWYVDNDLWGFKYDNAKLYEKMPNIEKFMNENFRNIKWHDIFTTFLSNLNYSEFWKMFFGIVDFTEMLPNSATGEINQQAELYLSLSTIKNRSGIPQEKFLYNDISHILTPLLFGAKEYSIEKKEFEKNLIKFCTPYNEELKNLFQRFALTPVFPNNEKSEVFQTHSTALLTFEFFASMLMNFGLLHEKINQTDFELNTSKVLLANNKKLFDTSNTEINTENIKEPFAYLFFYKNYLYCSTRMERTGFSRNHDLMKIQIKTGTILDTLIDNYKKGTEALFIGAKDATEKDLKDITNFFTQDYHWAMGINQRLNNIIDDIMITPYLEDLIQLYLPVFNKDDTNPTKIALSTLKETILSLYRDYFSIDLSEITINYTQAKKLTANEQDRDISNTDSIKKLITILGDEKDKKYLNKLIDLQIRDFIFKTATENRKNYLAQQKLAIPSVLENTPISLVCVLLETYKEESVKAFALSIIEKSRTPEEFAFICYTLLQEDIKKLLENKENALSIFEYVIEKYIQEKIDPYIIQEIYNTNESISLNYGALTHLKKRTTTVSNYPRIINAIKNIITTISEDTSNIPTTQNFVQDELKNYDSSKLPTFKASQNLMANMQGSGLAPLWKYPKLNKEHIARITNKISTIKDQGILGKIMQCVEAGSEKSAIEGTIIETLQNSIDAVSDLFKNNNNIVEDRKKITNAYSDDALATIELAIAIKQGASNEKNSLVFSIHDQAGFPDLAKLLIDFLLPDYSSKSPEKGNIGDMGNGSFKIYQNAQKVSVLTRLTSDPTKFYLLIIEPLRNKNNLVYDLDISCDDVSDTMKDQQTSFWGTSIKVTFKEEEKNKTAISALATNVFLQESVGTVSAHVDKEKKQSAFSCSLKNTLLNNTKIDIDNDVIFEYPFSLLDDTTKKEFTDRYKERFGKNVANNFVLFRIMKRKDSNLPSYITTGGIPFRPFGPVAKEMKLLPANFIANIHNGLIVDLSTATYKPIQSRAQLNMSETMKKALRSALFESYYIWGLKKEYTERCFTDFYTSIDILDPRLLMQVLPGLDGTKDLTILLEQYINGSSTQKDFNEELFFVYYKSIYSTKQKSFAEYLIDEANKYSKQDQDCFLIKISKLIEEKQKNFIISYQKINQKISSDTDENILKKRSKIDEKFSKHITLLQDAIKKEWNNSKKSTMIMPSQNRIDNKTYGLFDNIVLGWLYEKNKKQKVGLPMGYFSLKTTEEKKQIKEQENQKTSLLTETEKNVDLKNIKKIIQTLFETYCNLRQKNLTINVDRNKFFVAAYSKKRITFNLSELGIADLLKIAFLMVEYKTSNQASLDSITDSLEYKEYFAAPRVPATDINHELEHARREEDNDSSDYGKHGIKPFTSDNDEIITLGFDQSANYFAEKAFSDGLLLQWIDAFYEKVKNLDIWKNKNSLNDAFFENLRKLESTDKEKILNKIFI